MTSNESSVFITFEAEFEPAPPNTPASPRPLGQPRETYTGALHSDPMLVSFGPTDEALAQELADRVQEYVKTESTQLTPQQIAALVQQILAKRAG